MGGWKVGRWVPPADAARETGREPVYVPHGYLRLVAMVALGGLGAGVALAILALLGIRPH